VVTMGPKTWTIEGATKGSPPPAAFLRSWAQSKTWNRLRPGIAGL